MIIAAFDPGETTGWAVVEDARALEFGEAEWENGEIFKVARDLAPRVNAFVVEDYKIRTNKKDGGFDHCWQSVIPARVIGALRVISHFADIPFHLQQPSVKPAAFRLMGGEYKKGRNTHYEDALAHGIYFFKNKDRLIIEE